MYGFQKHQNKLVSFFQTFKSTHMFKVAVLEQGLETKAPGSCSLIFPLSPASQKGSMGRMAQGPANSDSELKSLRTFLCQKAPDFGLQFSEFEQNQSK